MSNLLSGHNLWYPPWAACQQPSVEEGEVEKEEEEEEEEEEPTTDDNGGITQGISGAPRPLPEVTYTYFYALRALHDVHRKELVSKWVRLRPF